MFCDACIRNEHPKCPGKRWCYCQHRPIETVELHNAEKDSTPDTSGSPSANTEAATGYPDTERSNPPVLGKDA